MIAMSSMKQRLMHLCFFVSKSHEDDRQGVVVEIDDTEHGTAQICSVVPCSGYARCVQVEENG